MVVISLPLLHRHHKEIKEIARQLTTIAEIQSQIDAVILELKVECEKIQAIFKKNIQALESKSYTYRE